MSRDDERTPPPAMMPMMPMGYGDRSNTGGIPILMPQFPQPDGMMSKWWKEIVAICTGMAAVGAVCYFVAKQFFVTRDEWTTRTAETNKKIDDLKINLSTDIGRTISTTISNEFGKLETRLKPASRATRRAPAAAPEAE